MHAAWSEDQEMMAEAVRGVLSASATPEAVRATWGAGEGYIPACEAGLAEMGVPGLLVPEEQGGLGLGLLELVPMLLAMGKAAVPGPTAEVAAVGAPLLAELGWAPELLGAVVAGESRVAVGIDSAPVAHAEGASLLLLSDADRLVGVRPEQARLRRVDSVDGAARCFDVEAGEIGWVAEGEAARAAVDAAWDRGALMVAALQVGLAQQMLDLTVDYAGVRRQFGKPIGTFQAVKHKLADVAVAVAFARPLLARAAWSFDQGHTDRGLRVSAARVRAERAAALACQHALQVHGAIGYTIEHDLHMWMKRSWTLSTRYGTANRHRDRVAIALIEQGVRHG